jgi:hypothetical protein
MRLDARCVGSQSTGINPPEPEPHVDRKRPSCDVNHIPNGGQPLGQASASVAPEIAAPREQVKPSVHACKGPPRAWDRRTSGLRTTWPLTMLFRGSTTHPLSAQKA